MGDRVEGQVDGNAHNTAVGKDIKQDTTTSGNVVNVNLPSQPQTPQPYGEPWRSLDMSATVEEKIRDKLNAHDIKLAQLELIAATDKQTFLDYVYDLRNDIAEIKIEMKPLVGLDVIANHQPEWKTNLLVFSSTGTALLLVIVLIYLTLGGPR